MAADADSAPHRPSASPLLSCPQAQAAESIGRDISSRLSRSYLSACDLSSALGQVFTGVAQGSIKRKTVATLAYLGQTMLNSIQAAQHEYINAFASDSEDDSAEESTAQRKAPNLPHPRSSNSSLRTSASLCLSS